MHITFSPCQRELNNGNKSAGHPEQLTVNIQATAMLCRYLQIRSIKIHYLRRDIRSLGSCT